MNEKNIIIKREMSQTVYTNAKVRLCERKRKCEMKKLTEGKQKKGRK